MRVVSSMFFQNNLDLSYIPPLSKNYLSNSIQGCAPYYSSAGIFTSSMKIAIRSFGLAPKRVFVFFWSLDSIASWVYLEDVWAEKFKNIELTCFDFNPYKRFWIITDFPTPVPPVNNEGFWMNKSFLRI